MAANETLLGKLHSAVTAVLLEAMAGQALEGYLDPDTGEQVAGTVIPPSAAVMTVAAKFLKDNNITCEPAEDNDLGALADIMAEKQRKLRGLDQTDRASLAADISFMGRA